ncbi:acyl-CoA thioester hydrolase/BAAT C-terminal domain-containing protein [Nocardioides ochotonae]|uniref:acyl-CoA thioester hydrolase/BAAT C-terminal domain-containing protein n=1 Tax=Nocardioides ochotonae TaxID=2685869 RepID=UPI001CD341AB|nr:acyl-CoA thioester hydrolase/BAAT C-terminal domain-containing protein [Nocardioides ochotonae]
MDVEGVRWIPESPSGVAALVLAGSSGRVDSARAELLARHGVLAESIRWFGGAGQNEGPWEIPLELFLARVDDLARTSDRVVVLGTSFGAEAALLTGAHSPHVSAVAAFAPSDVVWAGVRPDGSPASHWTLGGTPLPYVDLVDDWEPETDPPAFRGHYEASRDRFREALSSAAIPVEHIDQVLLVAGGDDQVWPSQTMAEAIAARRDAQGLETLLVLDPDAGHRTVLPGEPVAAGGMRMRRGGTPASDSRLGAAAWSQLSTLL